MPVGSVNAVGGRPSSFSLENLRTAAREQAAVFDVDGTLMPHMMVTFWAWLLRAHPGELLRGPMAIWNAGPIYRLRQGTNFDYARVLEGTLSDPHYQTLYEEYAQQSLGEHVFARSAEELAWHRANLHQVALFTGAFHVFLNPFIQNFRPDFVVANSRFHPTDISVQNKQEHVAPYLQSQGLQPRAIYTDTYHDRHFVDAFNWDAVHLMAAHPDKVGKDDATFAAGEGARVLGVHQSEKRYPAAVRDYAQSVIRGDNPKEAAADYYARWWGYFSQHGTDIIYSFLQVRRLASLQRMPNVDVLKNILSVAGLYLKESPDYQQNIKAALGENGDAFEEICFRLYQKLVSFDSTSPDPLSLLDSPQPVPARLTTPRVVTDGMGDIEFTRAVRWLEGDNFQVSHLPHNSPKHPWASHYRENKKGILDAAAQVNHPDLGSPYKKARPVAMVLFAGEGFDVPLKELAEKFHVILVDIDRDALGKARAALPPELRPYVDLEVRDVWGGDFLKLIPQVAAIIDNASDAATALRQIATLVESYQPAVADWLMGRRVDLLVSTMGLSDANERFWNQIYSQLYKRFEASSVDYAIWSNSIPNKAKELQFKLQTAHIQSFDQALQQTWAVGVLSADIAHGVDVGGFTGWDPLLFNADASPMNHLTDLLKGTSLGYLGGDSLKMPGGDASYRSWNFSYSPAKIGKKEERASAQQIIVQSTQSAFLPNQKTEEDFLVAGLSLANWGLLLESASIWLDPSALEILDPEVLRALRELLEEGCTQPARVLLQQCGFKTERVVSAQNSEVSDPNFIVPLALSDSSSIVMVK